MKNVLNFDWNELTYILSLILRLRDPQNMFCYFLLSEYCISIQTFFQHRQQVSSVLLFRRPYPGTNHPEWLPTLEGPISIQNKNIFAFTHKQTSVLKMSFETLIFTKFSINKIPNIGFSQQKMIRNTIKNLQLLLFFCCRKIWLKSHVTGSKS